jgi:hypothetical protein
LDQRTQHLESGNAVVLIAERRFKTTDVANMMDSDANHAEDTEDDTSGTPRGPTSQESISEPDIGDVLPTTIGYSRASMRGLQQALAQGWLIQRARDMCSFTHDKYRQAATHMASQLPDIVIMRMCLKVKSGIYYGLVTNPSLIGCFSFHAGAIKFYVDITLAD